MSSFTKTTAGFFIHSHVPEEEIPGLIVRCQPGLDLLIKESYGCSVMDMGPEQQREVRYQLAPIAQVCEWGEITQIEGDDGTACDLYFQALAFTAEEIETAMDVTHPRYKFLQGLIHACFINGLDRMELIRMEAKLDKMAVGLGGHSSRLVGNHLGRPLLRAARDRGLVLVDGNSQTATRIVEATLNYLKWSNFPLHARVGIAGATGSVGRQVATLLNDEAIRLTLMSRHMNDLEELKEELGDSQIKLTTSKEEVYSTCDLVISVTGEVSPWKVPRDLPKKNQRIFDASVPYSVDSSITLERPDVLLIQGVFTSLPGSNIQLNGNFDHPGNRIYPCALGTIRVALERPDKDRLKPLPGDELRKALNLAQKFGAKLAPPMGPGYRELSPEDFYISAHSGN